MSLRHEQYRALQSARNLLYDLLNPKATPWVPREVRQMASRALKHYPCLDDDGRPMFSNDQFSPKHADQPTVDVATAIQTRNS